MPTLTIDLQGKRGVVADEDRGAETFKAFIVVSPEPDGPQPANAERKGIVLCLDTGDSQQIKLRRQHTDSLGLADKPKARFGIGPLSAIKGGGVPEECAIVDVDASRLQHSVDLQITRVSSAQVVVSAACLDNSGKYAVLNPKGLNRTSVQVKEAAALKEEGVKLYCTDVQLEVGPTIDYQIPVVGWSGAVPFVNTQYYATDPEKMLEERPMIWDTGAPFTTVPAEYAPKNGIAKKIVIPAGQDQIEFLNVRVAAYDEYLLGCDLITRVKMFLGAPGSKFIGISALA